jgi:hypothetical protein
MPGNSRNDALTNALTLGIDSPEFRAILQQQIGDALLANVRAVHEGGRVHPFAAKPTKGGTGKDGGQNSVTVGYSGSLGPSTSVDTSVTVSTPSGGGGGNPNVSVSILIKYYPK